MATAPLPDYNVVGNYNQHPFYFHVSPRRQEAMDAQVCIPQDPPPARPPIPQSPALNRYACHGVVSRGGYDACSNVDDAQICRTANVPGIS